jgi:hypothetical protein
MTSNSARQSKAMLWTGRVLSALPVLMMLMGSVYGFTKPAEAQEGMSKYGYPKIAFYPIMIAELLAIVLYVIPWTSVLGAILLTGYLGGAVATHVRAGEPTWIAPVIVGVVIWLGLFFRDPRVRALAPIRSDP